MGSGMTVALAHASRMAIKPLELVRLALVFASALALILAGQAVPF